MADYIIAAASTADLPESYFRQHQIPIIRYTYSNGSDVFYDDCEEETRIKAYQDMRAGTFYTTSMINEETYYQFFSELMEEGKNVLYLDMSREMSSSYNAALEAAQRIKQDFPNQELYMVDTRCISGGLGLLVEESVRRMERGASYRALIAWIEANKLRIMHRFTVDDLNFLKRGGRVSNGAALIGSLLGIKPVLYVPDDGTLVAAQKVRGRKAAIKALLDGVKRDLKEPKGAHIIINHADCPADAAALKADLLKEFPTIGQIEVLPLGVVIGAHCGPGLLTVFYFGDQRKP